MPVVNGYTSVDRLMILPSLIYVYPIFLSALFPCLCLAFAQRRNLRLEALAEAEAEAEAADAQLSSPYTDTD